jgi:UDP-N-acetylmuramate--alanine ligase
VDDYAHHPTEVAATLAAARVGLDRRIVAVFQPHLYSRTRDFSDDFGAALLDSDVLIVTGIYPAREEPIEGVTGELVAQAASRHGHKQVRYLPDAGDVPEVVADIVRPGDLVVTMGAGDIWNAAEALVERFASEDGAR